MNRFTLLACLACVLIHMSVAFVCHDTFCDHVQQEPLNCAGGIIEEGGLCGCTDICAQVKGEPCGTLPYMRFLLIPGPEPKCDDGLSCVNNVCV